MRFSVTNELACALGVIAKDNPGAALQAEWREGDPERIWRVLATDGQVERSYVVDDETGVSAPMTEAEVDDLVASLS